ncbi:unnamed protein product [Mytilus edulis]|uniref:Uncharacterized protein n=1 Tax=Mytilus edulis TaxID=6550 RepID=A0A8S3S1J2_MYTED|nr:unnamed protein product [Mytilus edulis]
MLTRNIDITIGLVNGVIGTVISILLEQKGSSLSHANNVLFDNENIGRKHITSSHPTEHKPIDITPIEESLRKNAVRYQFPLQLAWACTTHKVQGITTDKAVISMKNIFAAGMAYVALSRVKSKDGLLLQDLDEDKIYCTEQISTALQRMPNKKRVYTGATTNNYTAKSEKNVIAQKCLASNISQQISINAISQNDFKSLSDTIKLLSDKVENLNIENQELKANFGKANQNYQNKPNWQNNSVPGRNFNDQRNFQKFQVINKPDQLTIQMPGTHIIKPTHAQHVAKCHVQANGKLDSIRAGTFGGCRKPLQGIASD